MTDVRARRTVGAPVEVCLAILILQKQGQSELRFPLDAAETAIGRGETNDVVIEDRTISREHAVITCSPQGHSIRDLGSRNGTWVVDRQLGAEPQALEDGNVIRFGHQVSALFLSEEGTISDTVGGISAFQGYRSMVFGQLAEGSRQIRFLKLTPWLRMAAAVLGVLAGALSLLWWSLKFFFN